LIIGNDTIGRIPLAVTGCAFWIYSKLGVLYHYYAERYRRRMEVMLAVVGWVDGTYVRLWDIQAHKDLSYTKRKEALTPEQYKATSSDLRSRLLANEIPARVALVYGEGEELGMVNQLRKKMLEAARRLWKAPETTWEKDSSEIMQSSMARKREGWLRISSTRPMMRKGF
jgi:hypothetical protein